MLDTLEPPLETFSDIPSILEDASRRAEFHQFGWAHTRGDGIAYLPNEKILARGDAIVSGPLNFTGHANTGNWPNVIREAVKRNFEKTLPGHGVRGGREVMEGQLGFFEGLNAAVEAAFEAKTPLGRLERLLTRGGYGEHKEHCSKRSKSSRDTYSSRLSATQRVTSTASDSSLSFPLLSTAVTV